MFRPILAGLSLMVVLALAACQPSAAVTPAPAAPTGIPLQGAQIQPQVPSTNIQAQPVAPSGQPTPPPSFSQGAEAKRAEVPVAPKAPGAQQAEVKPTTEPAPVKALGPQTPTKDKIMYVRSGRIWVANADGKDQKALLDDKAPQLWSPPKDPGRAWVSPSGRLIAYLAGANGGLWVADIDGKNNRQLNDRVIPRPDAITDKEADKVARRLVEQEFAWNQDETQIAFLGAPNGQVDLYIANLKTNQVAQVTNDVAVHGELAWSPKGDMLAFKSREDSGNLEKAYLVRGSQLVTIPTDRIAKLMNETDLGGILTITWLDDRRLFFYPVSGALQSLGIWLYDTADGSLNPIMNQSITTPDYNKATQRWTFISTDKKDTLYALELGGQPKVVVAEKALAPIWTLDGKRIIYSVDNSETYDIHIINFDGTGDKTLATNVNLIGDNPPEPSPAGKRYFTPDGRLLVYAAVGADYGSTGNNLENWWTVPLDGSQAPTPLTDIPRIFYIRQLAYSPDKASYAFTGLRYADRATHLWTFSANGGSIVKVDAEVRWFRWLGPQTFAK